MEDIKDQPFIKRLDLRRIPLSAPVLFLSEKIEFFSVVHHSSADKAVSHIKIGFYMYYWSESIYVEVVRNFLLHTVVGQSPSLWTISCHEWDVGQVGVENCILFVPNHCFKMAIVEPDGPDPVYSFFDFHAWTYSSNWISVRIIPFSVTHLGLSKWGSSFITYGSVPWGE